MVADLKALGRHILEVMGNGAGEGANAIRSISGLYSAIEAAHHGGPPIGRSTFYSWFGKDAIPGALLLECIPAIAAALHIRDYELYQAAKVLPSELDATMALSTAAHEFRRSFQLAARALRSAGLSTAGEALVVDRILNHKLDYKITVWPVVRGNAYPLHFHSWVILQPIQSAPERRRTHTASVDALEINARREHIRDQVISDGLWRSLGLRWRVPQPLDLPTSDEVELLLEIPLEERNREPNGAYAPPRSMVPRILALSAPFGHGELLTSLLAEALRWGNYDVRYQGFRRATEEVEKRRFCEAKLADKSPFYAWSIAEPAPFVEQISANILEAAERHVVIWITYGQRVGETAARNWKRTRQDIRSAQRVVERIVKAINKTNRIIHIDYSDDDLVEQGQAPGRYVDRNMLSDQVLYSAAEVLNLLREQWGGPDIMTWGDRFSGLRRGLDRGATVPERVTTVRWCEVGELTAARRREAAPPESSTG